MKDQNVQESPDVQVGETIDGIEHPDPRMRPARLSIRIPALFWGRIRRHIERCQSSPAERMLWEQWLSTDVVAALLAGESFASPGFASTGSGRVLETALRQMRAVVLESLQHPLALRLDPESPGRPGSPSTDPAYLFVLTNGATIVLRITSTNNPSLDEMIPARLDDCFFTRAAADFARPAGDLDLATAPNLPGRGLGTAYHGRMRDAVVREWVGRYAMAMGEENMKGLVPPDRPCDVNGPPLRASKRSIAEKTRVHFLVPNDWGFTGGPNGCVWVGYEHSGVTQASEAADPDRLREIFMEHGPELSRQSQSSSRNTSSDSSSRRQLTRYPLKLSSSTDGSRTHPTRINGSRRHSGANDALACLPELARAMEEQPWGWIQSGEPHGVRTAADSSSAGAAYRSALALGRCRLLGPARADLAELTLAPSLGISAARELALRLKQWARQAKLLPADLRGAAGLRASDLCMGVLEARLEAWSAYLAIDESYTAAVDGADASVDTFSEAIDAVLEGLAAFDDAIQFAEPLLASVVAGPGSRLLDNWKTLLAAPYHQSPPWWLDCVPQHATLDAEGQL